VQVWKRLADWAGRRRSIEGQAIGFVPTMGALHRGHASLVERCRPENQIVIASIFVNPTQFNDARDLERYPRTLENDLALLESLGVDDVLAPSSAELYPQGYGFRVEGDSLTGLMEGRYRTGFLQGVMTVVLKLFNLVRPGHAYFGEKDYQQLLAIRGMVEDFLLPVEIVGCPTVREPSGLAESSRNRLLSAAAREKAACLFRALSTAPTPGEARKRIEAEGLTVEYLEEHWGRRFAAAHLEGVRLIDNVPLSAPAPQTSR